MISKNPKTSSERRKVEKTMTQVLKLQTLNSHLATTGLEDAFMSSISGLCPTENLLQSTLNKEAKAFGPTLFDLMCNFLSDRDR